MADPPILDNEFATLWYHPDTRIVHHEIKQLISGQPFRTLLDEGFKALVRHRATKWLSDDRRCGKFVEEDEVWVKEIWLPRMMRAGWKYWALVKPLKALAQIDARRYADNAKMGDVTTKMFGDPLEAMVWLQQQ